VKRSIPGFRVAICNNATAKLVAVHSQLEKKQHILRTTSSLITTPNAILLQVTFISLLQIPSVADT